MQCFQGLRVSESTRSEESRCITKELDCRHEHGGECGYVPATEGAPCGFLCAVCSLQNGGEIKPPAPSNGEKTVTAADIQAKIDELPEAVTGDNSEEVRGLLEEIFSLYGELSEEEQEKVDLTRCIELQTTVEATYLADGDIIFNGLKIGNVEVTAANKDNVLSDGSVSYTESAYNEATLTLNNCKLQTGQIVYQGNPGGKTLTIQLAGDNSLKMIDVSIANLIIKGQGSLTIQNGDSSCIYNSGHVVISNGATVTLICNSTTGGNEYGIYTNSNLIVIRRIIWSRFRQFI